MKYDAPVLYMVHSTAGKPEQMASCGLCDFATSEAVELDPKAMAAELIEHMSADHGEDPEWVRYAEDVRGAWGLDEIEGLASW